MDAASGHLRFGSNDDTGATPAVIGARCMDASDAPVLDMRAMACRTANLR